MLIRTVNDIRGTARDVDWINGTSCRLIVAEDQRGYTLTDTYVRPGTSTLLQYDNHLESCYCIEGSGHVKTAHGEFGITAGTLYAPEQGEEHRLSSEHGMRLICVFNPALNGDENHQHVEGVPSGF